MRHGRCLSVAWGGWADSHAESGTCQVRGRVPRNGVPRSTAKGADSRPGLGNWSSKMIRHLKMTFPHVYFVPDTSHCFNFLGSWVEGSREGKEKHHHEWTHSALLPVATQTEREGKKMPHIVNCLSYVVSDWAWCFCLTFIVPRILGKTLSMAGWSCRIGVLPRGNWETWGGRIAIISADMDGVSFAHVWVLFPPYT